MNELLSVVLLILGLVAAGILRRYLRNRQRLRLVEMAHKERLLALEKGIPPSEFAAGTDVEGWLDEAWAQRSLEAGWDRRMALAIGLVISFAGVGALLLALMLPPWSRDAVDFRIGGALGVIPLMGGLGLLLYYRLTAPRGQ